MRRIWGFDLGAFWQLLRRNRNYRALWLGQTVSEIGDHFNSIAVLSLALHLTGSGAALGIVMIARVLPAVIAGPVAGVVLDRMDRRKVMLLSDALRAVVALAHVLLLTWRLPWLLYTLSGMLTFASPFFTSGRSAILPRIAEPEELHTANALTQTTSWLTLAIGTMLGGLSTAAFGYRGAFVFNALSFVVSALAIWYLRSPEGHFRPEAPTAAVARESHWQLFRDGLAYMGSHPLLLAIGLLQIGWSSGGGAAQVLFTLFGEVVFKRGSTGTGLIWSAAGVGLVLGGLFAHRIGQKLNFAQYKHAVTLSFLGMGLSYVGFSLMPTIWGAMVFIALSRIAMGTNSVLNRTILLTYVPDGLRGRVFTTVDAILNASMMLSMGLAGIASLTYTPRQIGVVAGILTASTAIFWAWANAAGKLTELEKSEPREEEERHPVTPA
ncbi:MAG: MFS transporter [Bryobacteraceae bacterium]|nr:MFS transporter [Bryobacteraceae bacterium]